MLTKPFLQVTHSPHFGFSQRFYVHNQVFCYVMEFTLILEETMSFTMFIRKLLCTFYTVSKMQYLIQGLSLPIGQDATFVAMSDACGPPMVSFGFSFFFFFIWITQFLVALVTNTDYASKSVSFYPSSLMISRSSHQFSLLDTKALFGFWYLPSFLHSQIINRLWADITMK